MLTTLKINILKYINSKGYKIDKVRKVKKFDEGNSIKIEFFGISGVGKSFLYKKVYEKLNSSNEFVFENEIELYSNKQKYRSIESINKSYDLFREILFECSFEIKDYFSKLGFLSFSQRILIKEEVVKTIKKKAYILLEEGVFHFPTVLKKLFYKDKEAYCQIVENTILIYCYTSADNIIKNKKKRIKEKERSHLDLVNIGQINKKLLDYENFLHFAESETQSLKILRIDTSLDVETNVEKILKFIEVQKSKRHYTH